MEGDAVDGDDEIIATRLGGSARPAVAATAPGGGQVDPIARAPEAVALGPGPITIRRALLVGVQKLVDQRFPERPGTCAAVRRIGARLAAGGWEVALLLDDEPDDDHRPWRACLLDRLGWLRGGDDTLVLLSGPVREGWFCPRDARLDRLPTTAIDLHQIAAELPTDAGVIVDAPADASVFARVGWAVGAGPEGAPESLAGPRGPTPFLKAVVRAMSGEDRDVLSPDSLATFIDQQGAGPWHLGGQSRPILTGLDAHRRACEACGHEVAASLAAYCPACGAALGVVELLDGGRYRLLERLGAGGMGQVFLAEDTRLRVERALKLLSLPPGLKQADRETLRARMIQEARAAQTLCGLTHHVVQVYDVGFSPERGEPFLVMELLRGETLTRRLDAGRMSVQDAVAIGRQMARTLAIAHGHGFVHRDLKPDNVMLIERRAGSEVQPDFVKLLDFGLVKAEQNEVQTETGRMMGTLQYMPPEQLRGLKVDARADVFSLGAVLYECLAGVRANPGTNQQEIFGVLLDRGVRSLAEVAPEVPAPLVRLVDACLKLIPEQRPADARAVADALDALDDEAVATADTMLPEDVAIVPPPPPPPRAPRRVERRVEPARRSRRWLLLLPAVAIALGAVFWAESRDPAAAVVAPPDAVIAAPDVAVDAAPVDAAPPPGPTPFARPADALPPRPDATRQLEDDALVYTAASPADAFAAWVIDVTLSDAAPPEPDLAAAERWAEAPDGVRAWLAEPVGVDGATTLDGRVRVPITAIEAARDVRPTRHPLRQVGTLYARAEGPAVWASVNCGRASGGDRLLTARWKQRGYAGGACEAADCPAALARALQNAHAAGERLQIWLTLARWTKDGEVAADHESARCHVRP